MHSRCTAELHSSLTLLHTVGHIELSHIALRSFWSGYREKFYCDDVKFSFRASGAAKRSPTRRRARTNDSRARQKRATSVRSTESTYDRTTTGGASNVDAAAAAASARAGMWRHRQLGGNGSKRCHVHMAIMFSLAVR
jgi:hypothetical protein